MLKFGSAGEIRDMAGEALAGRIAFVTGGLRGIGFAAAKRLLADGARVVIGDLDDPDDAQGVIDSLGAGAIYVRLDVTDEADWAAALALINERYGRLHILVNNAGTDLTGPVEAIAMQDWRRIMAVNVDGVFLGARTFTPLLAASGADVAGGASIINVSSIMGLVGYADTSAYNATKGAVRLFTKGIAIATAAWARYTAIPMPPSVDASVASTTACTAA